MKLPASLLFLGTGGSMGIPVIGCDCHVCSSESLFNKRFRPSVLLTVNGKKILIDCGPDFHYQALKHDIKALDGLILTHAHYDHTAGIDELRAYYMRTQVSLPCLLSEDTLHDIKARFNYIFAVHDSYDKLKAKIDAQPLLNDRGEIIFQGLALSYFSYEQAGMKVTGLRFNKLAYVTDIKNYPETIFDDLQGVEVLVLSALRFIPSALHFSVDDAIQFSRKVGAKHTWLTHIAHEIDHEHANTYLPENIHLAYDGLQLNFEV